MGSAEAGERNAVIYTLVANCRLHDIEPYGYLKDVLTRLPTTSNQEVEQLTEESIGSPPGRRLNHTPLQLTGSTGSEQGVVRTPLTISP